VPLIAPVTIGPASAGAGKDTVSGTITLPVVATGPLYVALVGQYVPLVGQGAPYFQRIATPAASQAYSIPGVPAGSYTMFAFLDQNGNGCFDDGDLFFDDQMVGVVVAGDVTKDVTLPAPANARAVASTAHSLATGVDTYEISFQLQDWGKRAVAVTLVSGKGIAAPADLGRERGWEGHVSGPSAKPVVGDVYRFQVTYRDATSEVIDAPLTAVLDPPVALVVNTSSSRNVPTFEWAAPALTPSAYGYSAWVHGPDAYWSYPFPGTMPSSQLSVPYNVGGGATAALKNGTSYAWGVRIVDANGNWGEAVAPNYTP
jgi:hypothetical protein